MPKHPNAEARNAPSTEKKPRKRRPTLVAPPPAYGNKIVLERATQRTGAGVALASSSGPVEL